jgi:excinuclease ABC subunit A
LNEFFVPEKISIKGARVHNLKNVSLNIPKGKLVVMTGLSGSGKSSLAFDTVYAEGQRRYMESLSSYARQFLELQDKPDVDEITGLSPTIAIDQRSSSQNPRSTVGTITEIYDFLRLLFARAGRPHCHLCGEPVVTQTVEDIAKRIMKEAASGPALVLAPVVSDERGEHKHIFQDLEKGGVPEVRVDGEVRSVAEAKTERLSREKRHTIEAVVARLTTAPDISRAKIIASHALEWGDGFIGVLKLATGEMVKLSKDLMCPKDGITLPAVEPRLFSFNNPQGACPACTGLGTKLVFVPELVIPNSKLTLAQGAVKPWMRIAGNREGNLELIAEVGKRYGFTLDKPLGEFGKKAMDILLYGTDGETYAVGGQELMFEGIIANLEARYRETDSDYVRKELEDYMQTLICPACNGRRLRPEALAVRFASRSISDFVAMAIDEAAAFFLNITKNDKKLGLSEDETKIAKPVAKEIMVRLQYLLDVGLGYLTLDRSAVTLSGGEAQRVRLSTQLGTSLSGVIYILDEPSIGLHPRDTDKLMGALVKLKELGNSVIVVEHDAATMKNADWLIDVGPGAGEYGGEIVAEGTPAAVMKNSKSLTGQYLSGKKEIAAPKSYRKGNGKALTVVGAQEFNLKNIDVKIPLGKMVTVSGVSGSGKSTLILDILGKALSSKLHRSRELPGKHKAIKGIENIDKVVAVDQSPIGRTPRSNPATYTGVFTAIRDLFTEIPEAKAKSYDAGKFSFNVKGGGRCEACSGEGYVQIEMFFLPDVFIECKECHGKRYNREALEIHYKDKTIADVLEMTVEEGRRFFADQSAIADKLGVLAEVGLGYIRLGQPANTLSGGEAQRVKLATELSRRETGRTLYILDEPTTGLHFDDIKRLLAVLHSLVEKGNTVLVIEHNLDVIKCSDWVIDMGPDGGTRGGEIIAEGTPKDIMKNGKSLTGKYLKAEK